MFKAGHNFIRALPYFTYSSTDTRAQLAGEMDVQTIDFIIYKMLLFRYNCGFKGK